MVGTDVHYHHLWRVDRVTALIDLFDEVFILEAELETVRRRIGERAEEEWEGPGLRAAGVAMAFKLIESAQTRWRAVNAPHLVTLVRAGACFQRGVQVERPNKLSDHESGGDQQVA